MDFQDVTLLCHPPATSCTVLFHYADNSQNELGFDIFVFSVSDPQPVPAQSYRPATLGYGCCPGSDPIEVQVEVDTCVSVIAYNDAGDSDEAFGCFRIDTSGNPYTFVEV